MKPNSGGPVYPGPAYTQSGYVAGFDTGMTLRDLFAGQIIAAMTVKGTMDSWENAARRAYKAADAMIVARDWDAL